MASVDDEQEYKATRKLNGLDKDIQVGEYIRYKGNIGKVIGIFDGHCYAKYHIEFQGRVKVKRQYLSIKNITKHRPNIKDLIECGDYVNGGQVYKGYTANGEEKLLVNFDYTHGMALEVIDIKSVVTKEQFNSVMYKVKE